MGNEHQSYQERNHLADCEVYVFSFAASCVIIEFDVAGAMRDGVNIYIDLYRPETEGKYQIIIPWRPYGKQGRRGCLRMPIWRRSILGGK